jgi:hypothetical protein
MDPFTSIAVITAAFVFAPITSRPVINSNLIPQARTEYIIDPHNVDCSTALALNENVFVELLSYKSFKDGWDGDGSRAPASGDIDAAIAFVEMLKPYLELPVPMVTAEGQIGLYWNTPFKYIDLNFESNGTISIYGRDRSVVPNLEFYSDNLNPRNILSILPISELLNPFPMAA